MRSKDKDRVDKKAGPIPTDRFGARHGTVRAKINSVLSRKPKTMSEILEQAGHDSTVYNYLNGLVEDRKLVRDRKTGGYMLPKKK